MRFPDPYAPVTSFQAHIGNMNGVFIAYHNTLEIFGFQYMSLEEMANGLFGTGRIGENVFRICVALLEKIMDAIQLCCPQQVLFYTKRINKPELT